MRTNEFHILHGQPEHFRSSAHGVRSFCGRCGTQLMFRFSDGNEIDVSSCSLDEPERVPPEDNTRTSSRLSWIVPDGHPDHSEARDG